MGLDASAKFFYGMPLGHAIHELKQRDAEDGKRKCVACGKLMESKFCPDDGHKTNPVQSKTGWNALSECYPEQVAGAEGLEVVAMEYENEDSYVLAVEESLQQAGDLRAGSHKPDNPLGLGQSITAELAWDAQLKEVCKTLDIEFVGAQFFVGLYLSY